MSKNLLELFNESVKAISDGLNISIDEAFIKCMQLTQQFNNIADDLVNNLFKEVSKDGKNKLKN